MPKSILIIFLASLSIGFAQNEVPSTLFMQNYVQFNPAMSGISHKTDATILWRNQWTEVNGAPTLLWVNFNQRMDKIHGAAGINYNYSVAGFSASHTILGNYAYHIQTKELVISFGIAAGIKTYAFIKDKIVASDPNDPLLENDFNNAFQANAGIAVHSGKFNFGLSCTQVNSPRFNNGNNAVHFNYEPTFHVHGDYTFSFGKKWTLTPALHLFTDQIKIASTTSIRANFNEKLWFGINSWNLYSQNAVLSYGPMIGYDFKQKFRVGYSLEFYRHHSEAFTNNNNMTHEVVLSYLLK